MTPTNAAAWLPAKRVKPLQVGPAPYTAPGAGELVVHNGAVAINPVDWAKQRLGDLLLGHIKYPFVPGGDVAGTVAAVGPGVQRFRPGDRVAGLAVAGMPDSNRPAEGAFQLYTVVRAHLAAPLPDALEETRACVWPLTLATAAYGLFHPEFLALDQPAVPRVPPPAGQQRKVVIVTGGASSVGCNAVQLAAAAGYEVYSTASPKNFGLVERLGATAVFDYHSSTLVDDLVAAVQGRTLVGAYTIGAGAVDACAKVLRRCRGPETTPFIANAGHHIPGGQISSFLGTVMLMGSTMMTIGKSALVSYRAGVTTKFIDCKDLCDEEGVVSMVYRDFLPRALAEGHFVPAPEPLVVGNGLEKIQEAMDIQARGVSAQKVVVTL